MAAHWGLALDHSEYLMYYGGAMSCFAPTGTAQCPGYVGNPADATVEAGEACYNLYADWISDVVIKVLGKGE